MDVGELVDELRESQSAVVDDTSMMDGSRDVDRSSVRRSSLSVATSRTSSPSPVDRRPSPSPPPAHRPSTDPQDDNKPKEPQSPALFGIIHTELRFEYRRTMLITSVRSNLAKGRIADLSPFAVADGFVRSGPL